MVVIFRQPKTNNVIYHSSNIPGGGLITRPNNFLVNTIRISFHWFMFNYNQLHAWLKQLKFNFSEEVSSQHLICLTTLSPTQIVRILFHLVVSYIFNILKVKVQKMEKKWIFHYKGWLGKKVIIFHYEFLMPGNHI